MLPYLDFMPILEIRSQQTQLPVGRSGAKSAKRERENVKINQEAIKTRSNGAESVTDDVSSRLDGHLYI